MADRGRYEVAVLGAGSVGPAIAYALAGRGVTPVVIDAARREVPFPGPMLAAVQRGTIVDVRLAVRSVDLFPGLQDAVGPFGYLRTGGLTVALNEAEAEVGQARAVDAAAAGLPIMWLSPDEVLRREPGLSEQTAGALYCPHDGQLDGAALRYRLLAAAVRSGAAHLEAGYVTVARQNSGFRLRLGADEVVARRLVLASAEALESAGRLLDIGLPLRTTHRRVCVTQPMAPLVRHAVNGIRQRASGELVLDPPSVMEDEGPHAGALDLVEAMRRIAAAAGRLFPALEAARIHHAPLWVSVEPRDGRPVVGRLDDDIYVAIAGADDAPGLSPLIAEVAAEMVVRGRPPDGVDIWMPARFAAVHAGAPDGAASPGQDSAGES
jgi:glycine/D-amino acid oxidase-like deaminating enzyme